MFRDYLRKNVPTEAQRKTDNNPHAQLCGTSNNMKLKMRILLHYTTDDQILIHHQDPKTKKDYEITPVVFHCGSSEEVLLLTNTWQRYLWTKRMP